MKKKLLVLLMFLSISIYADSYKIVCERNIDNLNKSINDYLSKGWYLNGSPFIIPENYSQSDYHQKNKICQCIISKSLK